MKKQTDGRIKAPGGSCTHAVGQTFPAIRPARLAPLNSRLSVCRNMSAPHISTRSPYSPICRPVRFAVRLAAQTTRPAPPSPSRPVKGGYTGIRANGERGTGYGVRGTAQTDGRHGTDRRHGVRGTACGIYAGGTEVGGNVELCYTHPCTTFNGGL